ncbi:hypothetical protein JHK87_035626 [Glycine soja]|nr:hypothetical protein JHK87_035626 [Glycine soja]
MVKDVFCYAACFRRGTLGSNSSTLFFITDRELWVISVKNFSGILTIGGDGSWVCEKLDRHVLDVQCSVMVNLYREFGFFYWYLRLMKEFLQLVTEFRCNKSRGDNFHAAPNIDNFFVTFIELKIYCFKLAEELGVIVPNPWVTCFKAASLPAIVCLLLMPLILYKLYPPEIKDTPEAPALAAKKLESMGLVIKNEWIMVGTMLLAVSLWIFGIASAVAAMIGLSILLLLGVLDWNNCWNEKSAWDTLAWFAILVGMASQLTNLGYVSWMSDCVANNLRSFSLSWPASVAVLHLFASQTGHVGALYSAFLAMHKAGGVPGILAALALGYNTNLFGAITL